MKMKKHIFPAVTVLVFAFLISGCALTQGYGKIRPQLDSSEKMTTQALWDNRNDYNIYYAGCSARTVIRTLPSRCTHADHVPYFLLGTGAKSS